MDDDKTQRLYIRMRPKTERRLALLEGMATIKAALDAVPQGQRIAGFLLAEAIVDRELAECRMQHAQNVMRDAAAAGVNIAGMNLYSGMENGELQLYAVPLDLAERAEG